MFGSRNQLFCRRHHVASCEPRPVLLHCLCDLPKTHVKPPAQDGIGRLADARILNETLVRGMISLDGKRPLFQLDDMPLTGHQPTYRIRNVMFSTAADRCRRPKFTQVKRECTRRSAPAGCHRRNAASRASRRRPAAGIHRSTRRPGEASHRDDRTKPAAPHNSPVR
jgi:hypothetical protein